MTDFELGFIIGTTLGIILLFAGLVLTNRINLGESP